MNTQSRDWGRVKAARHIVSRWSRTLVCCLLLLSVTQPAGLVAVAQRQRNAAAPAYRLAPRDAALLEDLERRSFRFFWEHADPHTGLVRDRTRADATGTDEGH